MISAIACEAKPFFRSRNSFSFSFFVRKALFVASTFILTFTFVSAAQTSPAVAANKVALSVDLSKTGAKIDRNIFGQFAEHLGHEKQEPAPTLQFKGQTG